jgi:vesicle-associated membrane protein 2
MSAPGAPAAEPSGDGAIVGGPRTPQQIAAQRRLQQTQAQVDEVVGIMRVNVEKVLERDSKLSELDYRTDALQQGASQFEQQAGKLKRKYWWKNLKMMIIMGVIGLIIIIIIGISIFGTGGGGGGSKDDSGSSALVAATTTTPKAALPGTNP